MARSGINKVILIGNLGADPELRTTAAGDAVATISIATSDSWKDKNTGEEQQKTPDVTIIGVPKFKSEFTYEVIDTLSFKIKYSIFP